MDLDNRRSNSMQDPENSKETIRSFRTDCKKTNQKTVIKEEITVKHRPD